MCRLLPIVMSVSLLLVPGAVRAGTCSAAAHPVDFNAFGLPDAGAWSYDLSFQYVDQADPRIGTRSAQAGEIPSHHDEVRTINRSSALTLRYAPSRRFQLGVTLPWASRYHEHLVNEQHQDPDPHAPEDPHHHGSAAGDEGEPHDGGEHHRARDRWSFDGAGDLLVEAEAQLWSTGRTSLWLLGGVELPTGDTKLRSDEGKIGPVPLQPGSGSTDAIGGLTLRGSLGRQGPRGGLAGGADDSLPYFVSISYRRNGKGRLDYRLGDAWQLNAGGSYAVSRRFAALLQLNARWLEEDSPGRTHEEPEFTGGTFVFASPGAQISFADRWAGYLYVQLPVYQDVNQLQLTSDANWLLGVRSRF